MRYRQTFARLGLDTALFKAFEQQLHALGMIVREDPTAPMLDKARERAVKKGVRNVRLLVMDAEDMKFADNSFDIVYAPYLISVVPDPVAVVREMCRVCRRGRPRLVRRAETEWQRAGHPGQSWWTLDRAQLSATPGS